ncbi:unnamed protein product [Blepharisma stoltei]|uniref:RING-type domain-containing protein n=1 Tax=Blepharisma stoltei TaxID=1481888 RepID=A0AAU9KGM3_9CILI|nr:unnamed protein product [Blepharisma stoltei]
MFYNFVKLIEVLAILGISALEWREDVTQVSPMYIATWTVDNATLHWKSDIIIELASKTPKVPVLLMAKKSINPSFSFNITSGTYDHDADYYDFDAWSKNETSSWIVIPKSLLKEGDAYKIGVYSEYMGVSYILNDRQKNDTVNCYQNCSLDSKCKKGNCVCPYRGHLGRLCDTPMNQAKNAKNQTVSLESDQWQFFYYDPLGKDYTIKVVKNIGEPELYFKNLTQEEDIKGFLPGAFAQTFNMSFGENDTITREIKNDLNYWIYAVHCPKTDENCTFSIKINKDSSDSSGLIETWLVPLCVCVGLPFLGMAFCVCRKGCQRVEEEKEARVVREKEKCLTSDEMDDYFPEMQWDVFGKEFCACSFCSKAFENWEKARMLNCKHIFHLKCIDRWSKINGFCPVCKQKLIEDKDQSVEDSTPSRGSSDKKNSDKNNQSEIDNKPIDQKEIIISEKQVKDKKTDEEKDQENKVKQIKGESENPIYNSNEISEQEKKKSIEIDEKANNEKSDAAINKRIPIFKSKEEESNEVKESESESEQESGKNQNKI